MITVQSASTTTNRKPLVELHSTAFARIDADLARIDTLLTTINNTITGKYQKPLPKSAYSGPERRKQYS